jgi:hypothetical protein
MSCPAVIDVLVPSGPIVVDVVTPGPPGAIGSRWFTGASVPAADLGAVGDYYLRVNGDVYGPKASGWGAVQFTLTGAGGGASLSDSTPQTLGTAAAGTAATASRSDHRHAMPTAVDVGADAAGTAAAAIAAHVAAADAHFGYTTPAEAAAAAPVQSVVLSPPSGWGTSSANTGGSVSLAFTLPTGYSLPTNASQANWDAAYTERLQWDGGAAGLDAAIGRASLELGSAALASAGDFASSAQGALAATAVQPDDAAINLYLHSNFV